MAAVRKGQVRPVLDRTFPLEEAAAAHRLMESSQHIGKILLTIDDADIVTRAKAGLRGRQQDSGPIEKTFPLAAKRSDLVNGGDR